MLTPLLDQVSDEGLTSINRRVTPGTELHSILTDYMTSAGATYVALAVPQTSPETYSKHKTDFFSEKFPDEYVREVEGLLAQDPASGAVLILNLLRETAEVFRVKTLKDYHRVLLSLFVQSVQQINPTSRILFEMKDLAPSFGVGKFVSCETNQCCFRYLTAKLCCKGGRTGAQTGGQEVRLYVRDHVHHNSLLDLSVISKWMSAEYAPAY